jgi:hypothetical protein
MGSPFESGSLLANYFDGRVPGKFVVVERPGVALPLVIEETFCLLRADRAHNLQVNAHVVASVTVLILIHQDDIDGAIGVVPVPLVKPLPASVFPDCIKKPFWVPSAFWTVLYMRYHLAVQEHRLTLAEVGAGRIDLNPCGFWRKTHGGYGLGRDEA